MLEFWFTYGNKDLYSGKNVEHQELEQVNPPPKVLPGS